MRRLAVVATTLLLAGCGGGAPRPTVVQPRLPRALATSLRAQVDAVAAALAAGDGCTAQTRAAALDRSLIAAENAHRVPPAFRETLGATVNDLLSRITCTPPPPPAPTPPGHDHPKPPHGHGKDHHKGDH